MADFKITLEAARINAHLTQDEAAKKIGVNKATLVNWEKGRSAPSFSQVRILSGLSGIPMDYIFLPEEAN